ncbi:MAG TPA: hypothetical protein VNW53_00915 [Phenylobacterium sp.]|jgi:hypothetical protein|uniref:hypothetical protein n=1 Tax=Phenylobacterium sp. TaxID=1871053 RepID=UPI002C4C8E3C|nr:hypothetical protein [Phenylobacterium sp.]HXA37535.1 hypothetical protein [Phenylobacterium sp.]
MLDYETAESADYDSEWSDASYDAYPDWPDYSEAKRRPPPVKPSAGKTAYAPPRSGTDRPVTQSQLKEALSKVGQQITLNSNAIKTVDGRVRGVTEDQKKLGAFVRKETADRKKELDSVKRDLQQTKELSAIIPMITANMAPGPIPTLAPLLHLVPGDTLSGGSSSSSNSGSSGSLLSGSNLLAIAAIAVASGAFGAI